MDPLFLAGGLALLCLVLPTRMLILMSVLGVMLADTPLVPKQAIYFSRFVPSGILALRTLQMVLSRGRINAYLMVKAWLPFFFLAMLSIAYSVDHVLSTQRFLSALFILVGFGIGIPVFFSRTRDHQRLVVAIGLILGAAALYSLYLALQGSTGLEERVFGRASGVFNNPNTLGLMAMQAAFLVYYWWQNERRLFRRRLLFGTLCGIVIALLVTGSRASTLGLAVGGLVLLYLKARLEGRVLRQVFQVATVGLAVLLATDTLFPQLLDVLFRTETSSRTVLWERAWVLAQDNLFFGVGFGASDNTFYRDTFYLRSIGIYISGPHSSVMRLLVDLGLAGVTLAVWAFYRILRQAWRYVPYFEDPLLGAALYAAIIASLINSLFESWLFGFGSAATVPLWLFLALLSYHTDMVRLRILGWRRQQARHRLAAWSQAR